MENLSSNSQEPNPGLNSCKHPIGIKIRKECMGLLPKQEISQIPLKNNIDILDGEMEAVYSRKTSPENFLYNFMNQVN